MKPQLDLKRESSLWDYRNRSNTFHGILENPHWMKSYFSSLALTLPLPSLIKRYKMESMNNSPRNLIVVTRYMFQPLSLPKLRLQSTADTCSSVLTCTNNFMFGFTIDELMPKTMWRIPKIFRMHSGPAGPYSSSFPGIKVTSQKKKKSNKSTAISFFSLPTFQDEMQLLSDPSWPLNNMSLSWVDPLIPQFFPRANTTDLGRIGIIRQTVQSYMARGWLNPRIWSNPGMRFPLNSLDVIRNCYFPVQDPI